MSLGSFVDIQPGSIATMQSYDAAHDECCDKCKEGCTIGLTGVTTFMFGFKVTEMGWNDFEGRETDSTQGIYIRATLQTGKSDFQEEIEFDLMSGTAITVPACIFTPTIIYPNIMAIPPNRSPKFRVYMSVGKGNGMRGRSSHARRTFPVLVDAGLTSDPIPIPKFADAVSFNCDDENLSNVRILQQLDTTGGATIDNSVMGKTESESVPYAPGARSFRIVNETLDPITVYVSWRLAFG